MFSENSWRKMRHDELSARVFSWNKFKKHLVIFLQLYLKILNNVKTINVSSKFFVHYIFYQRPKTSWSVMKNVPFWFIEILRNLYNFHVFVCPASKSKIKIQNERSKIVDLIRNMRRLASKIFHLFPNDSPTCFSNTLSQNLKLKFENLK